MLRCRRAPPRPSGKSRRACPRFQAAWAMKSGPTCSCAPTNHRSQPRSALRANPRRACLPKCGRARTGFDVSGVAHGPTAELTAADVIRLLDLRPHPEGGHYCQTFRDPVESAGRAASTAIYFLLARGERSHWHRVGAAEAWHHYAGAPLELEIATDGKAPVERIRLGVDLAAGERPQAVVPPPAWQAAP